MKKNRNLPDEKYQRSDDWEKFEAFRSKRDRANRLEKISQHKHQELESFDDINRWFATEWERVK